MSGNKEKAETARDQLSVCGLAASHYTREGQTGVLEGPGAWFPASSTSTLGTHFCPEEPATALGGEVSKDQPQPVQVGSGRVNAFSPTVLLKLCLGKQKPNTHLPTLPSPKSQAT